MWTFIDLFSGGGGMSYGFHSHSCFRVVAAFDGEKGKPSAGFGSLGCNATYHANIGVKPRSVDLATISREEVTDIRKTVLNDEPLDVLSACPPCTGFSRAIPNNHLSDDNRNDLVERTALWAEVMEPSVIVMENARELIQGNFSYHYTELVGQLQSLGYTVHGEVHMLSDFGLPQKRERSLIIAAKHPLSIRTLGQLWSGFTVRREATTVRRAIEHLPALLPGEASMADPNHRCPAQGPETYDRLAAIPADGGSWIDLIHHKDAELLMTPAMLRSAAAGQFGSHPDVYGRMAWDRPSATLKRECAHIGNGRYAHPEQNRLCSVREMAILQGFPITYRFEGQSLSNQYRHIGDAVPPLISYQLAYVVEWILTGTRSDLVDTILPDTHLQSTDIMQTTTPELELFAI
jgi:DNA (cytosine-5)-methyltransferase 1